MNFDKPQLIPLNIFNDERGSFIKLFNTKIKNNFKFKLKDINYSINPIKGTLRGLHMQSGKFKENKIIFCARGSIYDVALNFKKKTNDFLKAYTFELKANSSNALYIPSGYAHGFQTLEDDTTILYFSDNLHNKESEIIINYADPLVSINWPFPISKISIKDSEAKFLGKI